MVQQLAYITYAKLEERNFLKISKISSNFEKEPAIPGSFRLFKSYKKNSENAIKYWAT